MRQKYRVILSVLLLVVMGWLFLDCAGNLAAGYRSVWVIGSTRDSISRALGDICRKKHEECIKDKSTYNRCIEKCHKAMSYFVQILQPIVNSALKTTVGILETAYRKKDKNAKWLEAVNPAVCWILKALKEYQEILGDKWVKIQKGFQFAEKVVCDAN